MMHEYRPKSREEITRNMSAIRSTGNRAEMSLSRALHARGFRYRKHRKDLPGRPDFAFATERVAVFVDGDYWHGRLLVENGCAALEKKLSRLSEPAQEYWRAKFVHRVRRDRTVTSALECSGWMVLRLWESGVKNDVVSAVDLVASAVRGRRALVPSRSTEKRKVVPATRQD